MVTGAVTRLSKGDSGYSVTPYKNGTGDIQIDGLGFHPVTDLKNNKVQVKRLEYYAKENVVFQGWSWRYIDDPEGTHRGQSSEGAIQDDFVQTVTVQSQSGVNKLELPGDKTSFTCFYRPNSSNNKVVVKYKYAKASPSIKHLPKAHIEFFDWDEYLRNGGNPLPIKDSGSVTIMDIGQQQAKMGQTLYGLLEATERWLSYNPSRASEIFESNRGGRSIEWRQPLNDLKKLAKVFMDKEYPVASEISSIYNRYLYNYDGSTALYNSYKQKIEEQLASIRTPFQSVMNDLRLGGMGGFGGISGLSLLGRIATSRYSVEITAGMDYDGRLLTFYGEFLSSFIHFAVDRKYFYLE